MTVFEKNNRIEEALHPPLDKYAIYLRKSREDFKAEENGEGDTLARHKKILTDLAARQGLYVEKIYEEVISGESIEGRPEIQQLMTDCYAGKYRGIIIVEVTRLSRGNQGDAQKILDCLKYSNNNNGLLVITPTKVYDIAHNSDDEEYMEFELFMSRREYKMIKRRMDRGRKQAVVEGNYMGSYRPYGYNIVKTRTARTLEPHPEEAPIVKKIFDWKVNKDMTAGEIARKLTALGVPTYHNENGYEEWSASTIKSILTNPTYSGKVRWNDRMQVIVMKDGELVSSRPRSNHTSHYMEYDGKHPALVSYDMFIQAKKDYGSDKTKSDFTLRNVFSGLLVCQKCGYAMVYNAYKQHTGAKARLLHRPSQKCKVKSAMYDDVMNAVIHGLKMYLEDFEMKFTASPVEEDEINLQIELLEKEKKKIQKILAKIFDDYEAEVYTANEFVQRKTKHNNRLEAINKQIIELELTIPEQTEYREKIVYLHEAIDMLKDESIDARLKNEYLKQFIDRIEFSRENKEEFIIDIYLK